MSKFKRGDLVRCLDNSGPYKGKLTVGTVYTVLGTTDDTCIYVIADDGEREGPYAERFALFKGGQETYIISGCGARFSCQAEAEAYAAKTKDDGTYVEIAKVVRRCTVKKGTISTLEDAPQKTVFSVGDRVRIRDGASKENDPAFVAGMEETVGRVGHVCGVHPKFGFQVENRHPWKPFKWWYSAHSLEAA